MKKNKGFTLIELLVVIAIIGVLASVVLASLNTARNKGADASVKANLSNARAEAEMFYDSTASPTYDGVCAATGANTIGDSVLAAWKAKNGASSTVTLLDADVASATVPVCHDTAAEWAAQVPLNTGTSYCVDSTGAAKTTANFLAASIVVCS